MSYHYYEIILISWTSESVLQSHTENLCPKDTAAPKPVHISNMKEHNPSPFLFSASTSQWWENKLNHNILSVPSILKNDLVKTWRLQF